MKLVTSNKNKLKEFQRILGDTSLSAALGVDLKEVKSDDPITVIQYKCLMAGEGCIVEDTVLKIDDDCVTDIRYRLGDLGERTSPARLSWITSLGVIFEDAVHIYQGITLGHFQHCADVPEDAFGFDPYFVPDLSEKTLYQLDKDGKKEEFSARCRAIALLKFDIASHVIPLSDIPEWTGEWQE